MSFYSIGEAIVPEKVHHGLQRYIEKTGKYRVPYRMYGILFLLSILLSIGGSLYLFKENMLPLGVIGIPFAIILFEIGLFFLGWFAFYAYYEFIIFKRVQKIEEVLPDFLQEVSINLKAGMSFDKALWNSVEPEFDVLENEIEIVATKVMAGVDTEQALKEFAQKYDSNLLRESIDLVVVGIRSGGDVSDLIDRVVENVKDASYLQKQLIASVTSFIIFIALIAVVISPMLFALSFNLMEIIQSLGDKLTTTSVDALPGGIALDFEGIEPEDFILYSKLSVLIIAAVSGIITADLKEGSIKAGIKYILLFTPLSYLVYIGMLNVLSALFGVLV